MKIIPGSRALHCSVSLVVLTFAVSADAAIATVSYSVNACPPYVLSIPAVTTASGSQLFAASAALGGALLTWNYAADLDPQGGVVLNGSTTIQNLTSSGLTVAMELDVSICPGIVANVMIGGTATLKLVADQGGGALACGPQDPALTSAVSDGKAAATLYYCPFTMVESGAGTISTSTQFGSPIPSLPGPNDLSSLGHRINVTVSPGDKAVLSLLYVATGIAGGSISGSCPGDVDEDGEVDTADLLAVLGAFGTTEGCGGADVDGDGTVDGLDLAGVLGTWGPCSG